MRHFVCFFLLAGSSVGIGCIRQPGVEGVVPVSGTVTYQGRPVEGATVVFAPQGPSRAACGRTDSSGRFHLTTLVPRDGALPGEYQVSVSKTQVETPMTEEESQAYFEKHGTSPIIKTKEFLPEKYKTTATSGLTAEVAKGNAHDFAFVLAD